MTMREYKRKSCWDVRLARARQARSAARKRNAGRLLAWLLFVLALLSIRAPVFSSAPAASSGTYIPISLPPIDPDECRRKDSLRYHEVDAPAVLRLRKDRYEGRPRPSLARLLKDLRRPAAKQDAARTLASRLPAGDINLREWVQEQIEEDRILELAVWTRLGRSEREVFAHWKEAAQIEAMQRAIEKAEADGPGESLVPVRARMGAR